jgi:prepilin-type N-terminal cleavage/methylation domain-containing protein
MTVDTVPPLHRCRSLRRSTVRRSRATSAGFTLMELITVITVAAILVAIALTGYDAIRDRARVQSSVQEAQAVARFALTNAAFDSRGYLIVSDFGDTDMDRVSSGVQIATGESPWPYISTMGITVDINSDGTVVVDPTSSPDGGSTVIAAPTGLVATPGSGEVTLTWGAPEPEGDDVIIDYEIGVNDGSAWTLFDDGVGTTTGATVTGLSAGTDYSFRVRAVTGSGTGDWSSTEVSQTVSWYIHLYYNNNTTRGVVVDALGDVYFSDLAANRTYRTTPPADPDIYTYNLLWYTGQSFMNFAYAGDSVARRAQHAAAFDMEIGPDGNLYFAERGNHVIRKVDKLTETMTKYAGTGGVSGSSGDGGLATNARLNQPTGIAFGPDGSMYIADSGNNRIRKVSADGYMSTFAGNGSSGYSGAGGSALSAALGNPYDVEVAPNGDVFASLPSSGVIVRIDSSGVLHTHVGGGNWDLADGVSPTSAKIAYPAGLAFDASGTLHYVDRDNHVVRKVDADDGLVYTIAGTSGSSGSSGDGGSATLARLNQPTFIAFSSGGRLYISDSQNGSIRVLK